MGSLRRFLRVVPWSLALASLALPAAAQQAPGDPAAAPPSIVAGPLAPAAQPTTAPNPASERGSAAARRGRRPKRPRWDLTLTAEQAFPTGADQLVPPGTLNSNQILPAGELRYNITPRLNAFVLRRNHFDVGGRQYKGGKPSYGGFALDIEWDEGLGYAVSRDLAVSEEYVYRYRNCCPNAGDPANNKPRVLQGPRTNVTWTVGPETIVGRPLRLHAEGTYVDHNLDLGVGLPAGTPVLGNTWVYKLTAYLNVPVLGQKKFVPYVGVEHFDDFFNNQTVPSTTNRSEYGVNIRGNGYMSYRAYVKNDHQTNPDGDVPHKVDLYLEASLHLHR